MPRLSALLLVLVAGCGLIDDDITRVDLTFPRHDFRVDSGDWRFLGSTLPSLSCQINCEQAAAMFCGSGGACRATCNQETQTCQVVVTVVLVNDFNLAVEAPAYQQLTDQPVLSVTIDDVFFDITENTLTVDTPPLQVWVGPSSVTGPSDPGAELVGTIDRVVARNTGRAAITFEGTGRASMNRYMNDFKTPFRVIVSGEVTLRGGEPVPMGRLVGSVQANAHVGI